MLASSHDACVALPGDGCGNAAASPPGVDPPSIRPQVIEIALALGAVVAFQGGNRGEGAAGTPCGELGRKMFFSVYSEGG